MAPPLPSRALIVAMVALLILAAAASHGDVDTGGRWVADDYGGGAAMPTACRVEDAEEGCAGSGGEATRRQLGGGGYIGYDALRRNAVPCSYRGASYYNCRPGGQANPYSRGCSSITRCRG